MRFTLLTLTLIGLSTVLYAQGAPAAVINAAPNPAVAYQGRLTEAGLPVTGTRSFTFSILDSQANELWNSGPQNVAVNNGLYAVELGGTGMPAIPATLLGTPNLKLHLAINSVALTPDTDLVPALQARSAFEFSGPLAGDVGGTQNATVVLRLNGVPLDATTAPTSGQALVFNGSSWTPATVTGIPGPQGPVGATGLTGATGPQGPIGPVGAIGPMGPTGATGATGPQGLPGINGRTVLNGTGAPGATLGVDGDFYLDTAVSVFYGPKGAITAGAWPSTGTSLVGPVGATGATGPVGPIGATGPQGPIGPTGATGLQGPTGATGAIGPQGLVGLTGATGPQGLIGLTGATGATGATGPQGPAGPPISFKGAWNNTVTYAIGDTTSENGSSYIARTANLAIDPATDVAGSGGNWALLAAAGVTGPTGATGPAGATGATGPAGPMGATGTVSVGTTTTGAAGSPASVTNTGTASAAVLNFTIPQGAAGANPYTNYNRATLSSNAAIPPNSLTDVLFNSFSGPMSSTHWSGGVFTVPASGFYSICGFISTTTSGGWPSAYLYLNGTLIQTDYSNSDPTLTNVWVGLNYMGPLALGDRIEVKVMDGAGFTVTPASYIVIAGY